MADLKTVLTDTLAAHKRSSTSVNHPKRRGIRLVFQACTGCDWTEQDGGDHDAHVADVLLGLSGVAVVELPEPDEAGSDNHGGSWAAWKSGVAVVQPAGKVIAKGLSLTPGKAIEMAADLLAAAAGVFSEGATQP